MVEADQTVLWIDLLRLNLKQKIKYLSKFMWEVDTDNSNMLFIDVGWHKVSFVKIHTGSWLALNITIAIGQIPYTIMQYLEYSEKSKKLLKSTATLVYYGSYYRLLETWLLSYTFENQLFWKEMPVLSASNISRIDYKIDFCYKKTTDILPIDNIIEYRSNTQSIKYFLSEKEYIKHQWLLFRKLKNWRPIWYEIETEYNKWKFQNWRSIGSKRNKSIYARCYEKLIDTITKWKVKLYDDYFLFSNVFRLEFEFRTKFNKNKDGLSYTYEQLSELENKIFRFLWLSDKKDDEKFLYQYKSNTETNFHKVDSYLKDFGWRWLGVFIRGYNPFIVLFRILWDKHSPFSDIKSSVKDFFLHLSLKKGPNDDEYIIK